MLDLVAIRRELHRIPELAFEEHKTSEMLSGVIAGLVRGRDDIEVSRERTAIIVLVPATADAGGPVAGAGGRRDVHDDRGTIPGDLDIIAAADEAGDDAGEHLAGLVLLEGELRDPVQLPPDRHQVKHGHSTRRGSHSSFPLQSTTQF